MKIYYSPYSSNARKARMAALQLGIDAELVPVDLAAGAQRAPEFLALNPMGRVPVLQDGDFVLWESQAIMTYLADSKPGNTLYPSEPRARADIDRWLSWAACHWNAAAGALAMENMLKKLLRLGEPDPVQVKRQETYLTQFGSVLDGYLGSRARPWICGDAVTLADLAVAAPLMHAERARMPVQNFANIQAWFSRVKTLEAWTRTEPPPLVVPA